MSTQDRERWDRRFATVGPGLPGPPSVLVGREELVARETERSGARPVDRETERSGARPVDRETERSGARPVDRETERSGARPVDEAGAALDVACGRGTVAVWLAERGLATTALDVSPEALRLTAELAAARGVDVTGVLADLDDGLPAAVPGPFDVVVCQRFRDPSLYPVLPRLLAPGGLLVVSVLSTVDDSGGSYRAEPGELRAAFGHLDVLVDEEEQGQAHLVARRP